MRPLRLVERGKQLERLGAAAGVTDDLDVGLAVQEGEQPAAHDGVVVDDEDADARLIGHSEPASPGASTPTSVPTPGRLEIVSPAPISAARLRIDSRP